MVADHFLDDEAQELFRKLRVQFRIFGEAAQAGDLTFLAPRIGRGELVGGLVGPDRLRDPEPFGQNVDHRRVDVVYRLAVTGQNRIFAHFSTP